MLVNTKNVEIVNQMVALPEEDFFVKTKNKMSLDKKAELIKKALSSNLTEQTDNTEFYRDIVETVSEYQKLTLDIVQTLFKKDDYICGYDYIILSKFANYKAIANFIFESKGYNNSMRNFAMFLREIVKGTLALSGEYRQYISFSVDKIKTYNSLYEPLVVSLIYAKEVFPKIPMRSAI